MSQKIGWATSVTDSKTTDIEGAATSGGQRSLRWVGDKAYRWVCNLAGVTLNKGDIVVFASDDVTKGNVYTFGQAAKTTFTGSEFGVVTSDPSIAALSFGWVQVYGYNASVNIIGVVAAIAVNEVQTVTPTTAATAGTWSISVTRPDGSVGSTGPLAYNAATATIQTAMDLASGVANGIVVAGVAPMSTPNAMTLTYSGAGYAGLPQTLAVVQNSNLTSQTACRVSRTTVGAAAVPAIAVGDILMPVSGQKYLSRLAVAGANATIETAGCYAQAMQAYGVAAAALKGAMIMGLM